MRPLKLVISAFCSYSGTAVIEMDRLGTDGLYLITGETGAGKTTVFDAITYALFGEASGSNRRTSTLRSKYAAPDAVTEVILTFAYDGSIYTVRRSPEYERPAKRGSERMTKKPASAELTLPDGSVITGIGDVNEKIREIICLDRGQFTQTVMIAQGDFVKLLTAGTEERVEILRRIFKTDVFRKIQESFAARCRELDEQYSSRKAALRQYISSFSCSPDDPLLPELEQAKTNETLSQSTIALLDDIIAEQEQLDVQLSEKLSAADKELESLNSLISEADAAAKNRRDLDSVDRKIAEKNGEYTRLKLALDAAEKKMSRAKELAAQIQTESDSLPRYDELDRQSSELIEKRRESSEAAAMAAKYERELDRLLSEAQTMREELNGLEGADATFAAARSKLENTEGLISRLSAFISLNDRYIEAAAKLSDSVKKQQDAAAEMERLSGTAERLAELKERSAELNARKDALRIFAKNADEYADCRKNADKAAADYIKLRSQLTECTNRHDEIQRLLWDHRAGVLAAELRDGAPCPVCGATEHPCPARLPEGTATEEELQKAAAKCTKLRTETDAASRKSGELNGKAAAMLETLRKDCETLIGGEPDMAVLPGTIAAKLAECSAEMTEVTGLYLDVSANAERLAELTQTAAELSDCIAAAGGSTGEMRTELDRQCEELLGCPYSEKSGQDAKEMRESCVKQKNELAHDMDVALKCVERCREIRELLPVTEASAAAQRQKAADAGKVIAAADAAAAEIKRRTDALAEELGHESRADAVKHIEAMMSEKADIETERERAAKALDTCGKMLAELSGKKTTLEHLISLAPDTDGTAEKERAELLKKERSGIIARQKEAGAMLISNRSLAEKIRETSAEAAKTEEQLIPMRTLSDTANGTLNGREKITLEAYAQTAYFERIIALANLRLKKMTGGQYELVRRRTPASKSGKSGLDLDIADNFNGSVRDVRSLSGGESFKAALSLALGLSDEIQSRSSVHLDTMFIDEGFGSLDDNSLDQAVNVLAELSGSNRLIGIISHVSELRTRIDKQLCVTKVIDPETGMLDTKVSLQC